jgi:uncharacterized protein YdiU (UPF0061 family)
VQVGPAIAGIERAKLIRAVNPVVIARNHCVEEALAAASDQGDLAPFRRLLDALRQPYDEAYELAPYAEPAPAAVTACYRMFCGTGSLRRRRLTDRFERVCRISAPGRELL